MFQATFEPAFLPIGTEVSAKYRGAFCEAKVKKLVKSVKLKVSLHCHSWFIYNKRTEMIFFSSVSLSAPGAG